MTGSPKTVSLTSLSVVYSLTFWSRHVLYIMGETNAKLHSVDDFRSHGFQICLVIFCAVVTAFTHKRTVYYGGGHTVQQMQQATFVKLHL